MLVRQTGSPWNERGVRGFSGASDDTDHREHSQTPRRRLIVRTPRRRCPNVAVLALCRRQIAAETTTFTTQGRTNMYRRKLITALAVGASCAGLIPAAMAGASTPPGSGGGGDYCAAHVALEAAFNGDDPSAIGPAVEAAQAVVPEEIAGTLADVARQRPDRRAADAGVHRVLQPAAAVGRRQLRLPHARHRRDQLCIRRHRRWRPDPGRGHRHPPRQPGRRVPRDRPVPPQRGHRPRRSTSCWRCPTTSSSAKVTAVGSRVRRARHRRRHGRRSRPPATTSACASSPRARPRRPWTSSRRPARHPRAAPRPAREGPTALHPRHARRVHGGRGWRGHHRLRRDDDDVDGHDAGHHRLTTQHPFQQPAAQRRAAGCCASRPPGRPPPPAMS